MSPTNLAEEANGTIVLSDDGIKCSWIVAKSTRRRVGPRGLLSLK